MSEPNVKRYRLYATPRCPLHQIDMQTGSVTKLVAYYYCPICGASDKVARVTATEEELRKIKE